MDMNLAKSALTERFTEFAPLSTAAADYDVVRRAIAHAAGCHDYAYSRPGRRRTP